MSDSQIALPPADSAKTRNSPILIVTGSLMRWLSSSEFERSILPFDLEPDLSDENNLRLDFTLSLNHIAIPFRHWAKYEEWYLGYEGFRLEFQALSGAIVEATKEQTISVKYSNTYTRTRNAAFTLMPKAESADISIELGSISFECGCNSSCCGA